MTRGTPVPTRGIAFALALALPTQALAQAGTGRRVLDGRELVGRLRDDPCPELVLPSLLATPPASRSVPSGDAAPEAADVLTELVRFFCGESLPIQVVDRGLLLATGTEEELSLASSVLAALRARAGGTLGMAASCLAADGRMLPIAKASVEQLQRFELAAGGADLKAKARVDQIVASGLVAHAPRSRLMVWHGVRATVRRDDESSRSLWVHGSALLSAEDEFLVSWGGPLRLAWSLRPTSRISALPGPAAFRAVPLGPLHRLASSPRPLTLGCAVPEREESTAPTLDRLQEILLVREPARSAFGRAKVRLWRDLALIAAAAKDADALAAALERAADVPQVRIEVRFGELARPALEALESTGALDPEAAASMSSAEVPSLLGQPFGVAFVDEARGRAARGIELEGLPLARPDRDVTLVARLAIVPALGSGRAASRPAPDKRVVKLHEYDWCVLERGSRADGGELVVLVRIRPGLHPR